MTVGMIMTRTIDDETEDAPFDHAASDSAKLQRKAVKKAKKEVQKNQQKQLARSKTEIGYLAPAKCIQIHTLPQTEPVEPPATGKFAMMPNPRMLQQTNDLTDSPAVISLEGFMMGAVAVVQPVSLIDTFATFATKVFTSETFKIYPNPVVRGSLLHLTFFIPGDFELQFFDNQGKLYQAKKLSAITKNQEIILDVPAGLHSGVYFLKATSGAGKSFVEKLVVK